MNQTTYTASEARKNLYQLIKRASKGLTPIEINLRGEEPVILISKAEVEAWLETLDVLSSSEEMAVIAAGIKNRKSVTHKQVLTELGLADDPSLQA